MFGTQGINPYSANVEYRVSTY